MDIIIGAGISGLSYALFNNSRKSLIFEKTSSVGGYCKTTRRNGFTWDYSGHFFHFRDEAIKKIATYGLGDSDLKKVDKITHILHKDNLIDFPFQKNIHQLEKNDFIDCLVGLFEQSSKDYSTFKEMIYAKFGKGIADRFLIPYNSKLYACDLDKLDKDAMGRFFPYAEKEDIILNFKKSQNKSYNGSFIYPRNGAFEHVKSIEKQIKNCEINLNEEITGIDIENKTVTTGSGNIYSYDNLISTIPFFKLLKMTGLGYDPDIYSWNKVLVFNLGFDSKGPNNKDHWMYFPDKEICFYRVGFYDNILDTDKTSLYVELGFSKDDNVKPEEWIGKVLKDLVKAGCISSDQTLVDYESIIMDPAYVHISNEAIRDVTEKKQILEKKNIYSIGRYGSWTYCSIEDNIIEARTLAEAIK